MILIHWVHRLSYHYRGNVIFTSAKEEWHSAAPFEVCDHAEVLSSFQDFHPEVREVIETAPGLTKWPIRDIEPIDKWSNKNLVLLGDACHAMTVHGLGSGDGN
jgi:6-hydroxynicotinate 3-monooxygenase